MTQIILRELDPVWRPHLEVAVWRPSRGVIDMVLDRPDEPMLVVGEFRSTLRRLEQHLRWLGKKAESLLSSALVGDGPVPPISRLLVLRSTDGNRTVAREFSDILHTAYPCRTAEAVASLRHGAPWPGPAIVWVRLDGDVARLLEDPPRGVSLGR